MTNEPDPPTVYQMKEKDTLHVWRDGTIVIKTWENHRLCVLQFGPGEVEVIPYKR